MAYSYLFSFLFFDDANGEKDDILYWYILVVIGILVVGHFDHFGYYILMLMTFWNFGLNLDVI